MIMVDDKMGDSHLVQTMAKNAGKVRVMQDIMDCLFFLGSSEKECKHCKKVVTCGFTWQALFSLNSLYSNGGFNDYEQNHIAGGR